jgi:hypothetical protein
VDTYPGGKAGAGVYQRLINLVPRHRVLVVPFAGHCGLTRHIKPAEHTIVIDADAAVCDWWERWQFTRRGRRVEIHHGNGIEWLRYRFGLTRRPRSLPPIVDPTDPDVFAFLDPPYVLSERAAGRLYDYELTDDDHRELIRVWFALPVRSLLCGYPCELYRPIGSRLLMRHQVPTRGGLQTEAVWANYQPAGDWHDTRYVGRDRRHRERIRRRQRNWRRQLDAMPADERAAMIDALAGRH